MGINVNWKLGNPLRRPHLLWFVQGDWGGHRGTPATRTSYGVFAIYYPRKKHTQDELGGSSRSKLIPSGAFTQHTEVLPSEIELIRSYSGPLCVELYVWNVWNFQPAMRVYRRELWFHSHSKGCPACVIYSRRVDPLVSGHHGLNFGCGVLNHGMKFEEQGIFE